MSMPATAAQPVLRIERRSAATTGYTADLLAWSLGSIYGRELVVVRAQQSMDFANNPFMAVRHEHRVTNRPIVLREEDSVIKPLGATTAAERYHGRRGRLLAFKKS